MGSSTDLWYTQSAEFGEQYRPVVHSVTRLWGAVQTCGTLSDQVMGSSTDLWYTQSAGYGEQYRPVVHSVSRLWGEVQTCGTLSQQVTGEVRQEVWPQQCGAVPLTS